MSLCSQSFVDAVNKTQRIGTFKFRASLIQTPRVSGSAFVLSGDISLHINCPNVPEDVPTTTLVPSPINSVAALTHFSRCFNRLLNVRRSRTNRAAMQVKHCQTYCF